MSVFPFSNPLKSIRSPPPRSQQGENFIYRFWADRPWSGLHLSVPGHGIVSCSCSDGVGLEIWRGCPAARATSWQHCTAAAAASAAHCLCLYLCLNLYLYASTTAVLHDNAFVHRSFTRPTAGIWGLCPSRACCDDGVDDRVMLRRKQGSQQRAAPTCNPTTLVSLHVTLCTPLGTPPACRRRPTVQG